MGLKETIQNIRAIPSEENSSNPVWYNVTEYGICTIADLRELVEAYERLRDVADVLVRHRDHIECPSGDDEEEVCAAIDRLSARYPRPVELPSAPSGGVLGGNRITFPTPLEGQTGWTIPGVGNFDLKGNRLNEREDEQGERES